MRWSVSGTNGSHKHLSQHVSNDGTRYVELKSVEKVVCEYVRRWLDPARVRHSLRLESNQTDCEKGFVGVERERKWKEEEHLRRERETKGCLEQNCSRSECEIRAILKRERESRDARERERETFSLTQTGGIDLIELPFLPFDVCLKRREERRWEERNKPDSRIEPRKRRCCELQTMWCEGARGKNSSLTFLAFIRWRWGPGKKVRTVLWRMEKKCWRELRWREGRKEWKGMRAWRDEDVERRNERDWNEWETERRRRRRMERENQHLLTFEREGGFPRNSWTRSRQSDSIFTTTGIWFIQCSHKWMSHSRQRWNISPYYAASLFLGHHHHHLWVQEEREKECESEGEREWDQTSGIDPMNWIEGMILLTQELSSSWQRGWNECRCSLEQRSSASKREVRGKGLQTSLFCLELFSSFFFWFSLLHNLNLTSLLLPHRHFPPFFLPPD